MTNQDKVASVVLNYNSSADVQVILPQLIKQMGINHYIIIVDNASNPEDVDRLQEIFLKNIPEGVITQEEAMFNDLEDGASAFLILNGENNGYSAGNNVGIRLAEKLGAEAILIANPDMRIENEFYIKQLADELFSNKENLVAASRILGVDGKDQNPQKESSFFQEVFWPMQYFYKLPWLSKKASNLIEVSSENTIAVPKVSGCCMMLRMSFMKQTDFLDESVFLYCEEPILSARVRRVGGKIIYVPGISAIHAHYSSDKGNQVRRTEIFIKSRKYFIDNYSEYSSLEVFLIKISYAVLLLYRKCLGALRLKKLHF